jgi:uncharacterized protein (DUF1810 family)
LTPGAGRDPGRFTQAQADIYARALSELRAGEKRSHWMWFIFPQVAGLGFSSTSRYYAIKDAAEARAYLAHPILGPRLLECTRAVLDLHDRSARQIFGPVDELKFRSSMTLFAALEGSDPVFRQALDKYFAGQEDQRTLELLGKA